MRILLYCVFVVHSLAYGLRPIKDYLILETNPNFLISIYVYPQTITITITKHWNTHRHKQVRLSATVKLTKSNEDIFLIKVIVSKSI